MPAPGRASGAWMGIIAGLLVAGPLLAAPAARRDLPPFVLIVNHANPDSVLTRRTAEDLFLKRTHKWRDGAEVMPVDLPPESPIRDAFCRSILNRPVTAVLGYWRSQIFSGRGVPPPELANSRLVMSTVAANPGGIGYVERELATSLPPGVRIIRFED